MRRQAIQRVFSPEDLLVTQKCQVIISDLTQDSRLRAASQRSLSFLAKEKKKSRFRIEFYRQGIVLSSSLKKKNK